MKDAADEDRDDADADDGDGDGLCCGCNGHKGVLGEIDIVGPRRTRVHAVQLEVLLAAVLHHQVRHVGAEREVVEELEEDHAVSLPGEAAAVYHLCERECFEIVISIALSIHLVVKIAEGDKECVRVEMAAAGKNSGRLRPVGRGICGVLWFDAIGTVGLLVVCGAAPATGVLNREATATCLRLPLETPILNTTYVADDR